jgi:hypothetical protein
MTIKVGDFAHITNEKLEADGFPLHSTVYVASVAAFPLTDSDGYTQRIKLFVHKVEDDKIDTASGVFVIDPASVSEVPEWEQIHLVEKYAPKEELVKSEDC